LANATHSQFIMNEPILLVEDEEHDVIFMRLAFERAGVKNAIIVERDGREAIARLNGAGKYSNRQEYPLPGLVFLDLRLPQVPGLEVLTWIRQQPKLIALPIIVCSSSKQDLDVEAARRLGASAFLVKPMRPAELLEIVRRIKQCWLDTNEPAADCMDWSSVSIR
jgi:CheY-like chemotaxis protein